MSTNNPPILLVLVSLGFASPIHGTVYKWIDARGITHFSDAPPAGAQYETVPQPPLPPADPERERRLDDLLQSQRREEANRQRQGRERRVAVQINAQRAESCRQATEQFVTLKSRPGPRILITEPDSTQRRLTEEERQTRLAEMSKIVAEYCEE